MRLVLVVAFVVVPLLELAVILQSRQVIGLGWTLLLLFAVSVVGAVVVKREGVRTWRAFRGALASGRAPAREVADGAMVLVGGALLLTPGFLTDLVGLLLVLPPSRAVLRRHVTSFVGRRMVVRTIGVDPREVFTPGPGARGGRGGRAGGPVVDGEVVDGGVVDGRVADGRVADGGAGSGPGRGAPGRTDRGADGRPGASGR